MALEDNCTSKSGGVKETSCKNTFQNKGMKMSKTLWMQNLSYYFSQYCSSTAIHGIKYLGERGRCSVEKLTWTIVLTGVFYLCLNLIAKTYSKWLVSPVIVTFATTETPIWKIPFPAITICPEVKTDPEIFNYTDVLLKKLFEGNVTAEEDQYFESFSLICDADRLGDMNLTRIMNVTHGASALNDLAKAFPFADPHRMSTGYWLDNEFELDDLLSGILTSEGLCYTFNTLEIDEILVEPEELTSLYTSVDAKPRKWSLEKGYPDEEKLDTFPKRTFVSGMSGGFMLDIYTNHSQLDYFCGESLQGFKVTLHHPSELPNMDQHFRLPLDQAVLVGIKPRMITVSEELKSYKPEGRKCFFANERHLTYFKSYTQQNCLDECLSNYTLSECGCLAFYMPRSDTSPFCGPGSRDCLEKSKVHYLSNSAEHEGTNSNKSLCNCLPSCTSLQYDVETSQTDWDWHKMFDVFSRLGLKDRSFDYENAHFSKLAVYYKELQFLTAERHELYGYVEFFSNVGGLLGLFVGFSVTSAIEIVYFLSLRLFCNIRKFGSDYWSGEPDLINAKSRRLTKV